jgi:uncharacterized delta-60 repeat protein
MLKAISDLSPLFLLCEDGCNFKWHGAVKGENDRKGSPTMENKLWAVRVLVVMVTITVICEGQSYWKRTYGYQATASALKPTPDGNFIVAGYADVNPGKVNYDVYLLKITQYGDTIWTKTYGKTDNDGATAITPTSDGNFIVAGYADSLNTINYDVYLLKITQNGDTIWTKTFRKNHYALAQAITSTRDGNSIVAGFTLNPATIDGIREIYLLKITQNGDTIWTKTFGKTGREEAVNITTTPDGNFMVIGQTYKISAENVDVLLLKITQNGDTVWTKSFGKTLDDRIYPIAPTQDGNFILAGNTGLVSEGYSIFLLKITQNGDTLWTKSFRGFGGDWADAISPTQDGNFIVAGGRYLPGAENPGVYLLKITPNGDTIWTKSFGGTSGDWATAMTPTPDGNFMVTGRTYSPGIGYRVFLLNVIDDRYAYKSIPFTFKIPVSDDSLKHSYTPLKIPVGMTVSPGGAISWTPQTDSVYMDHVEFLVSDNANKKDTLTFNIFVNSDYHPSKVVNPSISLNSPANQPGIFLLHCVHSSVRFNRLARHLRHSRQTSRQTAYCKQDRRMERQKRRGKICGEGD